MNASSTPRAGDVTTRLVIVVTTCALLVGCLSDDIYRPTFIGDDAQTLVQTTAEPDVTVARPGRPEEFGTLFESSYSYTMLRPDLSPTAVRCTFVDRHLMLDDERVAWLGYGMIDGDVLNTNLVSRHVATLDGELIEERLLPRSLRFPYAFALGKDKRYRYLLSGPVLVTETEDGAFESEDLPGDFAVELTPDASHAACLRITEDDERLLDIITLATGEIETVVLANEPERRETVRALAPSGNRFLSTRADTLLLRVVKGPELVVSAGVNVAYSAWTTDGPFAVVGQHLVAIDVEDGSSSVIVDVSTLSGLELGRAISGTPTFVQRQTHSVLARLVLDDRLRTVFSDATFLDTRFAARGGITWDPTGRTLAAGLRYNPTGEFSILLWTPEGATRNLELPDLGTLRSIAWSRRGFIWAVVRDDLWKISPESGAVTPSIELPDDGLRVIDGDDESACFLVSEHGEMLAMSSDGALTHYATASGSPVAYVPFGHPLESALGPGFIFSDRGLGLRLYAFRHGELTTVSWFYDNLEVLDAALYPTRLIVFGQIGTIFGETWVTRTLGAWIEE